MEKQEARTNLYRGIVFAMFMGAWVVFSGFLDVFHLTLGVISCGIVTWLSSDLLFQNRWKPLRRRFRETFRLIGYLFWLLWQILLANLHLLRLAFSSRDALQPQIVRYESKLETDFEKFLFANSITLTPGTVTMKIMGGTFYIHAISDVSVEGLDGEMEKRIARIFAA